ncbi:hypothetical protein BpJC7_14840 [Weizmannia acidilactici]|uniref:Uncharacterized protein n=1 Tax=Weizmannia acidilactici TaxID=2607726 RepID=A0A5J4JER3_9BACI|nr:hypothetical protein BpJC4_14950 [Weizmannia acidilactici]GER70181.1 hypothetical protein BpJC7_14840 [Weizmannia acidilactici]GER73259.1 hypothetical protein BpPP18_13260 [Weizmannia acidilactici]
MLQPVFYIQAIHEALRDKKAERTPQRATRGAPRKEAAFAMRTRHKSKKQ